MQNITINNSSNVIVGDGNVQSVTVVDSASQNTQGGALTVLDYFETYKRLDGRFFDRNQFLKKIAGTTVDWTGYVTDVSECKRYFSVMLTTGAERRNFFAARCPLALATLVYSLRENDYVRVVGTLDTDMITTPAVDDATIERLTVAATQPTNCEPIQGSPKATGSMMPGAATWL